MDRQDLIVAPATPPGEGGVAIIRLSGSNPLDLILPFFVPSSSVSAPESHRFYHGQLRDHAGETIDEVMFVYMAAPRSFTAEDVVEVHCHAGHQTVSRVLETCITAGARLARPGEFSYRAFLNGRIDLAQAEAIADLIHSRSAAAQSLALAQMGGELSQTLHLYTEKLRESLALVEAWIDFPEEELPAEDMHSIRQSVVDTVDHLGAMVDSYNTGRFYSEGVSLLLLGRPNVGKSSLMNALLGEERAIVTDIEGTTRDLLEEGLVINGMPVRLVDTAGIRSSDDPVERAGVARATSRTETADLVLMLVDGSQPFSSEDAEVLSVCKGRRYFLVQTKSDKEFVCQVPEHHAVATISVSAKTGDGLDALRSAIYAELVGSASRSDNSVLLTSQRHRDAAAKACEALERFVSAIDDGMSLEFLAVDLRDSLEALGEITGETTTDDILDAIFGRFCIGK